jgi:hypothetical protein
MLQPTVIHKYANYFVSFSQLFVRVVVFLPVFLGDLLHAFINDLPLPDIISSSLRPGTVLSEEVKQRFLVVVHFFDIWHRAKKIGEDLRKEGIKAKQRPLLKWVNSITNHFWFSAENCEGSVTVMKVGISFTNDSL